MCKCLLAVNSKISLKGRGKFTKLPTRIQSDRFQLDVPDDDIMSDLRSTIIITICS